MDWIEFQIVRLGNEIRDAEAELDQLEGVCEENYGFRKELREIQRLAQPGHAWPYDRVTRALEGK